MTNLDHTFPIFFKDYMIDHLYRENEILSNLCNMF